MDVNFISMEGLNSLPTGDVAPAMEDVTWEEPNYTSAEHCLRDFHLPAASIPFHSSTVAGHYHSSLWGGSWRRAQGGEAENLTKRNLCSFCFPWWPLSSLQAFRILPPTCKIKITKDPSPIMNNSVWTKSPTFWNISLYGYGLTSHNLPAVEPSVSLSTKLCTCHIVLFPCLLSPAHLWFRDRNFPSIPQHLIKIQKTDCLNAILVASCMIRTLLPGA